MSDSEEVTTPSAEEAPAPAATPAAAKKKKPSKSKSKKPSTHPKFRDMAVEAIGSLKERNGSSRQAILKYITANYNVDKSANNHLKMTLKAGVRNGTLRQIKGTGASGSFKLGEKGKDKPAKKTNKIAATTKKAKTDKKKVSKPKKTKAKTEKKAKASPKKKTAAKAKKTKSPKKASTKSKVKKGKAAKK